MFAAITFAPVQGFIEKSRKLRDLYGSSFLLSYLAHAICDAAQKANCKVISPTLINVTRGTPNKIFLEGDFSDLKGNFSEEDTRQALLKAWSQVLKICRQQIELVWLPKQKFPQFDYSWRRAWNAWGNNAWEVFWGQGDSLDAAQKALNQAKLSRDWTGINWTGESSTLSGADEIAWPNMTEINPKEDADDRPAITQEITDFYTALSAQVSNSILDSNERLSIPELVKRFITLPEIVRQLKLRSDEFPKVELPDSFRDLNRHSTDPDDRRWTGWFCGDGDRVGQYLRGLSDEGLTKFSQAMRKWGEDISEELSPTLVKAQERRDRPYDDGRMIYAGGDDFFGVLYRVAPDPVLSGREALQRLYDFPECWQKHRQPITASVGFVWASPAVPQRDVLQQARAAEQSAKTQGRDRLAIRLLFASGNHLEWSCPWAWLETILTGYRDRTGQTGPTAAWTHFYTDVATLEARHAFSLNDTDIAAGLLRIYFPEEISSQLLNPNYWWNSAPQDSPTSGTAPPKITGLIGDRDRFQDDRKRRLGDREPHLTKQQKENKAFNHWVCNLAKIGFHLNS